jgi:hypothetical protein
VHERDPKDAVVEESARRLRALVHRVAALDADEGAVSTGSPSGAVLRDVLHDGELLGHLREDLLELLEVVAEAPRPFAPDLEGVRRDDPGRSRDPGLEDAREVHLRVEARPQESVVVTFGEIVAPDPRPDVRVDVQIEHVARQVEVDRLFRDPELLGPGCGILTVVAVVEAHGRGV